MGSANGRHRRPRQAPAIVVAAGVTGSALAIPLLAATGAGAADATTWDKVAECESGGAWSADFGNGYYGGLQFSEETWAAYGGTDYAQRADLASRTQQIAVAEKVLDAKGPQAWPGCAVIGGLAPAGSLIGVDPGSTSAADAGASAGTIPDADGAPGAARSTDSAGSSGTSGSFDGSAAGSTTGSTATPGSDASATPSPTGSATPGATAPGKSGKHAAADGATAGAADAATGDSTTGGKHRGTPDAGEAAADTSRDSGRHASRGATDARDDATLAADGTYTVRSGDNLSAIADTQNLAEGWTDLYAANEDVIGSNPDLILPGQELDLSATPAPATPGATAGATDAASGTTGAADGTAEATSGVAEAAPTK
ncbi:transglycosylase family protein [Streptomyces sp. AM 2-1-1]|uniref:LysM peptidoglycan-binding domain-containing protein n=1 Tax=Streptomyces sp. AM 2-1-1 TaxID=3028709 RepID=UPI0023B8F98E|nr:transglycosylase family protein [Streptomyces sp. AM 2-1-1]WEH40145.1 transglycosylase family protein [Streptomyces sp. AM 2-1-1]